MTTTVAGTLGEPGIGSHALQHNGLASHAQEWQRELARAEARAWFHAAAPALADAHPGTLQNARTAAAEPLAVVAPRGQHAWTQQRSSAPPHAGAARPSGDAAASQPPAPEGGAASTRTVAAASPAAPSPLPARCTVRTTQPALAQAASCAAPATARQPSHAEVRLHVETGVDGVRVWMGLDGSEAAVAVRAASLLPQLRRALQVDGHRLRAFTCNGCRIDEAAPSSTSTEQTTWRSAQ